MELISQVFSDFKERQEPWIPNNIDFFKCYCFNISYLLYLLCPSATSLILTSSVPWFIGGLPLEEWWPISSLIIASLSFLPLSSKAEMRSGFSLSGTVLPICWAGSDRVLLVIGKVERGLLDGSERDKESNPVWFICKISLYFLKPTYFPSLILLSTLMDQHSLAFSEICIPKCVFCKTCKMPISLYSAWFYTADHILSFESMCEQPVVRLPIPYNTRKENKLSFILISLIKGQKKICSVLNFTLFGIQRHHVTSLRCRFWWTTAHSTVIRFNISWHGIRRNLDELGLAWERVICDA